MKKVLLSVGMIALLSGCAHLAPKVPIHAKPRHQAATPAPIVAPVIAAPIIVPAPPVIAPPPAKSFKQRWLSKFFRDRASR